MCVDTPILPYEKNVTYKFTTLLLFWALQDIVNKFRHKKQDTMTSFRFITTRKLSWLPAKQRMCNYGSVNSIALVEDPFHTCTSLLQISLNLIWNIFFKCFLPIIICYEVQIWTTSSWKIRAWMSSSYETVSGSPCVERAEIIVFRWYQAVEQKGAISALKREVLSSPTV